MESLAEIRTERLLLRPPTEADAPAMFERFEQDARVARFMSWTPHKSIEDTLTFLRGFIDDNRTGRGRGYLILCGDTGSLLGSIGGAVDGHRMQFGYLIAHDAWNRGYATEAATQFVNAMLAGPVISRVQAYCDVENHGSARVLEKAGLALEGTLRCYLRLPNLGPQPRDVFFYAKVRE